MRNLIFDTISIYKGIIDCYNYKTEPVYRTWANSQEAQRQFANLWNMTVE